MKVTVTNATKYKVTVTAKPSVGAAATDTPAPTARPAKRA